MTFHPALALPAAWRTTVTRERGTGTDARGNVRPPETVTVTDCLVASRGTMDPADHSEVIDSNAVLYRDGLDVAFQKGDVVIVPPGTHMAGRWLVDGRPSEWPAGIEVGLVRA